MATPAALFVDHISVYLAYGLYTIKGGLYELFSYPPLKPPPHNNWYEHDGLEVDLSAPKLDSREVKIKCAFRNGIEQFSRLIKYISDGKYHDWAFNLPIGGSYRLRYLGMSDLRVVGDMGLVTLHLADDFPLRNYIYRLQGHDLRIPQSTDYLIDGKKLTDYNISVLQGTLQEFSSAGQVKTNLVRNYDNHAGAIYDEHALKYEAREVKMYLLLQAYNGGQFWGAYLQFLYDLIRPNEREIYVSALQKTFKGYYKSGEITEIHVGRPRIVCKFTVTFVLTQEIRPYR